MQTLSCGVWDVVPWSEMEPGPPALGAWSLNYWTTRDVPHALFLLFFKSFIYLLLIFGCAGSPWLCAGFFSPLVVVSWGYSSLWCLSFRCGGFSRCRAQALGRGFRGRGTQTLECGLSSRGAGVYCPEARGTFLGQGLNPVAVAGRFLSLCHQGSPHPLFLESPYRLFFLQLIAFSLPLLAHSFPDSAASAVIFFFQ